MHGDRYEAPLDKLSGYESSLLVAFYRYFYQNYRLISDHHGRLASQACHIRIFSC